MPSASTPTELTPAQKGDRGIRRLVMWARRVSLSGVGLIAAGLATMLTMRPFLDEDGRGSAPTLALVAMGGIALYCGVVVLIGSAFVWWSAAWYWLVVRSVVLDARREGSLRDSGSDRTGSVDLAFVRDRPGQSSQP